MTALYRRRYELRINEVLLRSMDIQFTVTRSLRREPNTAAISIRNLSPDSRALIEQNQEANVTLLAGYEEDISLIFAGDLRDVATERQGPDIITTIQSGDGEKKTRRSRISRSYAPGTTLNRVVKDCAEAMGVGVGNLARIGKVEFPRAGATFPTGTVLDGNVSENLARILESAGLTYSIQDGQLQILTRNRALREDVLLLTPNTGLVGTASVGSDGFFRGRTLMIPNLFPGRRVQPQSAEAVDDIVNLQARGEGRRHLEGFSGIFRARKCTYTGDTKGNDWNIDVEADPLFQKAA